MHEKSLYDDIALAYDAWAGQLLADSVLDEMIVIQPGEQVCAVACGAGRDARYLAYRGATVTGVDLSANLIEIARAAEDEHQLGVVYQVDSALSLLSLSDASFCGVLCHMALMDIPELDQVLGTIARILSPGGWFVFSITHPCFKTPAYGEIVDHVDGSVRRTVGKCHREPITER
jgi:ubiquinone/menaquinone biosynthesis C-methylase UbiE